MKTIKQGEVIRYLHKDGAEIIIRKDTNTYVTETAANVVFSIQHAMRSEGPIDERNYDYMLMRYLEQSPLWHREESAVAKERALLQSIKQAIENLEGY